MADEGLNQQIMADAGLNQQIIHWFKVAARLEDKTWDSVVDTFSLRGSVHTFSREELHARLVKFGLLMGTAMLFLGVLAALALCKRRYGSVGKAISTIRKDMLASLQTFSLRSYALISEEEDEEDNWPNFKKMNHLSAADKQKDMERLAKLKADADLADSRLEAFEKAEIELQEATKNEDLSNVKRLIEGKVTKASRGLEEESANEMDALVRMQTEAAHHLSRSDADRRAGKAQVCSSSCLLDAVKIPITMILFATYVALCVGIPVRYAETVSCDQGLPWEAHMYFFAFFLLLKIWELFLLAYDTTVVGQLTFLEFALKFGSSFLAILDGYADANAIVVAHQCGSPLWRWMAIAFVVGVVLAQWVLLAAASMWFDSSKTCFFKMLHMDALAACTTMDTASDPNALLIWKLVNVCRFTLEDLPQSILQTLFVLQVKRNYVMIISIGLGIFTSAMAIHSASKRLALAAGTQIDLLRAQSHMQAALEAKDEQAYWLALQQAEETGGDPETLLFEAERAEETFEYASTVLGKFSSDDDQEPGDRVKSFWVSEAPEDRYAHRRRSEKWALQAAVARQEKLKISESKDCAAYVRGDYGEGRHTKSLYDSRRRSVDFAVQAAQLREARIPAMLVPGGSGTCVKGSRPKAPGEKPDAGPLWELKSDVENQNANPG